MWRLSTVSSATHNDIVQPEIWHITTYGLPFLTSPGTFDPRVVYVVYASWPRPHYLCRQVLRNFLNHSHLAHCVWWHVIGRYIYSSITIIGPATEKVRVRICCASSAAHQTYRATLIWGKCLTCKWSPSTISLSATWWQATWRRSTYSQSWTRSTPSTCI
jgi:hypothetical protein